MTRGRDRVKKDVLAFLTFLTTAVLFYLVQVEGNVREAVTPHEECGAVETGWVTESTPVSMEEVLLENGKTRDS
jgi:hypothetical protein